MDAVAAAAAHAVPLDFVRLGRGNQRDPLRAAAEDIVVGDTAEGGAVGADAVLARALKAVVVDAADLAGIDLHRVDLCVCDGVEGNAVRLHVSAENDAVVISACRLYGILRAEDDV